MDVPAHSDSEPPAGGQQPARKVDWPAVVGAAVIALVVVLMAVLHLAGVVGPGAH